jgi:hypothetical protein
MTHGAWEIVGQDYRELPLGKTIGDALRGLIRKRWPNNAAKKIETLWDIDPKTAKNVVSQGNVSERTLTKAALAERWALWIALGEEVFGESYAEYEERQLTAIIEKAEHARQNLVRLRARREALASRALEPDGLGDRRSFDDARDRTG